MVIDYMGIIDLNEEDVNIRSLTHNRPLASIPFGGRYRIIDFVLSNMVNAGVQNVGVFAQGKARSLIDHVGSGKPWDLNRKINGLFFFSSGTIGSYLSDVEMIKDNMEYLYQSKQNNVIMSSSYMICNIDYEEAVRVHEEKGSDVTVVYKRINNGTKGFLGCDVLNLDKDGRVLSVGKNIGIENDNNICMEMFIMKKSTLINIISKCVKTGFYRTLKEAIYKSTDELNIGSYEFKGYVECINSIDSYYKANMDLLDLKINNQLFFNNGLIYTKVKDEAPTKYTNGSKVHDAIIANGCIIEGTIENSIISRRVIIHKGAKIKNCIIMQNCEIKEGAKLTNIIVDKNVVIDKEVELKGDSEIPLVIEKKSLVNFGDFGGEELD